MKELTPELIIELKKEHGEIFQIDFKDQPIIFRALTFKEFEDLAIEEGYTNSTESEDSIVRTALLYPSLDDLDKLGAGLISVLAEEVLDESAFLDTEKARSLLQGHREMMTEAKALAAIFIISAMPAYKIEDLDNKTFSELLYMVAVAEEILGMRFQSERAVFMEEGGSPLMILGIEEDEEEGKQGGQSMDPIAQKLHQSFQ